MSPWKSDEMLSSLRREAWWVVWVWSGSGKSIVGSDVVVPGQIASWLLTGLGILMIFFLFHFLEPSLSLWEHLHIFFSYFMYFPVLYNQREICWAVKMWHSGVRRESTKSLFLIYFSSNFKKMWDIRSAIPIRFPTMRLLVLYFIVSCFSGNNVWPNVTTDFTLVGGGSTKTFRVRDVGDAWCVRGGEKLCVGRRLGWGLLRPWCINYLTYNYIYQSRIFLPL